MTDLGAWFDNPGVEMAAAETPAAAPEKAGAVQPSAPPSPAAAPARPAMVAPDRAAIQQRIEQHQRNMRAPEGSPEWRQYWKEGGAAAYGEDLRALEALDAAPPPMPAGGGPAPAQPAPE